MYKKEHREYSVRMMYRYLTTQLIGIGDKVIGGLLLGITALSLINLIFPIYMIFLSIGFSFIVGLGVQINYLIGKKDINKVNSLINSTFVYLIITLSIAFFIAFFYREQLLTLVKSDLITIDYKEEYYLFILFAAIPGVLGYFINSIIIADENTKYAMKTVLYKSLINFILNISILYIFDLGLLSIAIATFISNSLFLISQIYYFIRNKSPLIKLSKLNLNIKETFFIVYNGFSEFILDASEAILLLFLNYLILKQYGHEYFNAYSLVNIFILIIIALIYGGYYGISPLISKYHGNNEHNKIKELIRYCLKRNIVISFILYLSLIPIVLISSIFIKDTNITIVIYLFITYGLGTLFSHIVYLNSVLFTSIQRPLSSIIISLARTFIFLPILIIIFFSNTSIYSIGLVYVISDLILVNLLIKIINITKKSNL